MRNVLRLLPAFALVALAACAPDAPSGPGGRRAGPADAGTATVIAAGCDIEGTHKLINKLYPRGADRDAAHDNFNLSWKRHDKGDLASAWLFAARVLRTLYSRERAGTLLGAGTDATEENVVLLTTQLYTCAGRAGDAPDPEDLLDDLDADVAFGVAFPDAVFTLVVPSGNFGVRAPIGFFDMPAFVTLTRQPDFGAFPTADDDNILYPPGYRVTVEPDSAQVNLGATSPTLKARVELCHYQDESHSDTTESAYPAILRVPDDTATPHYLLPRLAASQVITTCPEEDPYRPPPPEITSTGSLILDAGRAMVAVAEYGARTIGRLFVPATAWAARVDGGMGGDTFLFSGFVVAEPAAPTCDPYCIDARSP